MHLTALLCALASSSPPTIPQPPTHNALEKAIQQSNSDMASVLHLTVVWEAITLAQSRQLYLIYKLPGLSPSQTGTAGACSTNLRGLAWVT